MIRPRRSLLIGAAALLTLIWGTTWAVIRIGLEGIPPFTGVSLRFAIAAAVLFLLARLMGVKLGRNPLEWRLWLVNGIFSFSIAYGIVYWAEQWVPSGLASVLWATFPLFMALMAHVALPGERITLPALVGVFVGFGGVALIFSEDLGALGGPRVLFASAVMLLSPVAASVSNVVVKRLGKGVHPISLTSVPMALTAVVMGVVAFLTERDREVTFDLTSVGALLYLALMGSVVTFTLYYWVLAHVRATALSLITYLIPVVAVTVGVLFMDEALTLRILAGALLVVGGVVLATLVRRRANTTADDTAPADVS